MSSENPSPADHDQDELKQALMAAFGDDALDMLDDDESEDCPPQAMAQTSSDNQASSTRTLNKMAWVEDLGENASPLIRYMHDLNRTIYGGFTSATDATTQHTPASAESRLPRFVIFSVDSQQFGLPLCDVREISRYPKVTDLPCSPAWLRGVTNLRGEILSVTDLRKLLNLADDRADHGEKIIVVHSQQHTATTAIVVDRVHGIRSIEKPPEFPEHLNREISSITSGTATIDQTNTILLDPDRLLACEQMLASSGSP
jgi:purine-binding chemotaxis protein CheW